MKNFSVKITETLERIVTVEAENELDAVDKITRLYNESKIVLDADNFTGVDIEATKL